ncbi:GNAT family N-acetyltransferase [Arthrobacter sp. Bz4]|nr:GNAT family N-acetyltransferase [Arthrobacter sp. Bz4]
MSIREAEKLDLTFLPAIEAAADSLLTYLNGIPLPVSLPAGASRSELAASLKLLVAGRPCIGFARLEELDGGAHLEQLAVLPAHAGRGTGRALVEAVREPSPPLLAIRNHEAAIGLDRVGRRVSMRAAL